jgi:hypothetical protein
MTPNKMIIGNLEACDLPDIGINGLHIRIDTGAATSSLHVDNIEQFKKNGQTYVSFDIHPDSHNVDRIIRCTAPRSDARKIKSSNGEAERRPVIKTTFALNGESWPIEITLTDRSDMSYLMLLGREGMADRILVDPSKSFIASKPN